MRAVVERSPFASPWVRQIIGTYGLPVWFGLNSIGGLALSLRDTTLLYFDARLYLMATQAWLAGSDPWDVQLAGNYFAAPPLSLLPLAPLAPLPLDLGVAIIAISCFAAAIATVRLLGLPWWWLLFPPLVQCLLSANVHALLIPLILLRAGWLATLFKIYAAVPVAILGRWRALLIAIILVLISAPILPWASYIGQAGEITARLAEQTRHDIPLPVLVAIAPAVGIGLLLIGRERAAWLAPLALWPSQQYYYGTLVMPTRSQIAAAIIALPTTGSGIIAVAVLALIEWRNGRRIGRPRVLAGDWDVRRGDSSHRLSRLVPMTTHDRLDVVVLGGGGHVGLPLSLTFADAGLRVGIYDTNQATLDRIAAGDMPFLEAGADELLRKVLGTGRLELGTSGEMIERTEALVVVIGTPVDEFLGPSMTVFERAVDQISPHLRDGALIVLRSTVYPGTTAYVTRRLKESGCSVDVAFCPERIAEGHALEELHSLPQIIGADDDRAGERATALFGHLVTKTVRTSTKEAELAKLFTNTWRYMKFAVANQFFMIADQAGVDYTNVLRAIREDYPRAADLPGPGFAAGPCLFKDAMQLAAFTTDHFPMGQAAMQVNEGLPAYIVAALERRYGGLNGKTVGILGMAFKAESDDTRASLSYKLRKLLSWAGARVLATDPYVDDDRLVTLDSVLSESDVLVLGAPHRAYRGLEVGGKDVVDVWGVLGGGIRL